MHICKVGTGRIRNWQRVLRVSVLPYHTFSRSSAKTVVRLAPAICLQARPAAIGNRYPSFVFVGTSSDVDHACDFRLPGPRSVRRLNREKNRPPSGPFRRVRRQNRTCRRFCLAGPSGIRVLKGPSARNRVSVPATGRSGHTCDFCGFPQKHKMEGK